MAQVEKRRRGSLPKRFGDFTNTTPGLDMTLRLLQALVMIAAEVCLDKSVVVRCSIAKEQLALGESLNWLATLVYDRLTITGRRYLRFLSGYGCFQRAYSLLTGDTVPGGTMLTISYLVELTCLGLYVSLEDLTIVLSPPCLFISNKLTNKATRYERLARSMEHTRSNRSEQVLVLCHLHIHCSVCLGTGSWLRSKDH
jgi:hypothetical protein